MNKPSIVWSIVLRVAVVAPLFFDAGCGSSVGGSSASAGAGVSAASSGAASTGGSAGSSTGSGGSSGGGSCGSGPLTLDGLVVTSPLKLSAASVAIGQQLSGSYTLCNPSSAAIVLSGADIAARPPGGTDATGPFGDLFDGPGVTVAAGQSQTISGGRVFTSADTLGVWYAYATVVDSSGTYDGNSADPDNKVTFTVVAAGATTSSPTASSSSTSSSSASSASSTTARSTSTSGGASSTTGSGSTTTGGGSGANSGGNGSGASNDFYIYTNGVTNAAWQTDYSFGSPVEHKTDTTHPETGHTFDFSMVNGDWQPGSTDYAVSPEYGWNISPYTYLTIDLWTAYPSDQFDMAWHYVGDVSGGTTDTVTGAYINTIQDWNSALQGSAWNTNLKIPLAAVGQLGNQHVYKFFFRDNTDDAHTIYLDNVGFIPGVFAWVYSGGSGPVSGWSDASSGASANYSYLPTDLGANLFSLNGLVSPGTSATSTNAIALSVTASGGMLKLTNAAGFDVSAYDHLTFGAVPTKSGYAYSVQLYDTSGAAVGTAVDPRSYTGEDWGVQTQYWTVYCIPLSAFGSVGSTIGGLSIKDANSVSTDALYFSAIGFYK